MTYKVLYSSSTSVVTKKRYSEYILGFWRLHAPDYV